MDRDTTFKDHHFWELQRRDSLNAGLSLQIGAVTLLMAGVGAMSKAVSLECSVGNTLLLFCLLVTGGLIAGTLVCLMLSVFGYGYAHTPSMVDLLADRKHFQAEYKRVASSTEDDRAVNEKALAAFYAAMDELYAKSAARNSEENRRKIRWIYLANRWLAASLISFAVAGLPYLTVTTGAADKPTQVHITNLKEEPMSENKSQSPPPPPPPPPATSQQEINPPPARDVVICFEHFQEEKKG